MYQTGNPQKKKFMALSDAYHGETLGALAVGGESMYSEIYKPILMDIIRIDGPDCYRCKYGKCRESCSAECFDPVEKAFNDYGEEV